MSDKRGRILCVEDDPDTFELISAILDEHDVVGASSCAEAIRLVGEEAFRLVTMDYYLPDGSGLDLCYAIHTNYPKTPIIFVTGESELQERSAIDSGAIGVVYKAEPDFLDRILDFADHGKLSSSAINRS